MNYSLGKIPINILKSLKENSEIVWTCSDEPWPDYVNGNQKAEGNKIDQAKLENKIWKRRHSIGNFGLKMQTVSYGRMEEEECESCIILNIHR